MTIATMLRHVTEALRLAGAMGASAELGLTESPFPPEFRPPHPATPEARTCPSLSSSRTRPSR